MKPDLARSDFGVDAEIARSMIESARDYAIFMLDRDGIILTWNAGAERIKGYRADEIIGSHFSRFYSAEDVVTGLCDRELDIALAEGHFETEGWRLRKDGSRFWANIVITPVYRDGVHIGFSKLTRDLTERRRAEQEHLRLVHAQEALRLRDEFLSIAAHELRTPLAALQLQVDQLQEQPGDDVQRRRHARLQRNVERLAALVGTLLDVTRISTGGLALALASDDLGRIVHDEMERLAEMAAAARCEVTAEIAPGIVGRWDPVRMGQVAANLLGNAFKYGRGRPIHVELFATGDQVTFRVADRGPGIPAEDAKRIFERFERGRGAKTDGLGLGLYIVREIVRAHGGTVRAMARDGGGTVFEVSLPIRYADLRAASQGFR